MTSIPPLMPVPPEAVHLGTLDGAEYYRFDGCVWKRTATKWSVICLVYEWPNRPEAEMLALRYAPSAGEQ